MLVALQKDTTVKDATVADLSVTFEVHATVINRWKREALDGMELLSSLKRNAV